MSTVTHHGLRDLHTPKPSGPVRDVSRSSRGVTGIVSGMGAYESTLERDMMELIRFDRAVREFTPQPLTISYSAPDGSPRRYTPDGLIHYKNATPYEPSILFEVKFRADFRNDWKTYLHSSGQQRRIAKSAVGNSASSPKWKSARATS